MTDKIRSLKFKQFVNTSPLEVYEAFTSATAFSEGLCDVAQADVRTGGRLYLYWQTGYYASGEFIKLKPAQRVLYSWHDRGEPGLTYEKVSLQPEGDGTRLSLTHYELGPGKAWKIARKRTYFRLAINQLFTPYHHPDHCAQIQTLLSSVKNKALSEISNTNIPKEVEL